VQNGLSKEKASDAFGLPKAKFEALISAQRCNDPIQDPVVAMLWHLYCAHAESTPIQKPPNLSEFYDYLGFGESTQHKEAFAALIGRSPPSVFRFLQNGTPGRPVVRWVEAIQRMNLDAKKALMVMADAVNAVGTRQGVDRALLQGWGKPKTPIDDAATD
jgi:hypothetical protein